MYKEVVSCLDYRKCTRKHCFCLSLLRFCLFEFGMLNYSRSLCGPGEGMLKCGLLKDCDPAPPCINKCASCPIKPRRFILRKTWLGNLELGLVLSFAGEPAKILYPNCMGFVCLNCAEFGRRSMVHPNFDRTLRNLT